MLTDEEAEKIRSRIEGAFKPFRCVAEIWDYKDKLRFKVFDDNGKGIVEMPNVSLDSLSRTGILEDLIEGVRREIINKGFTLA